MGKLHAVRWMLSAVTVAAAFGGAIVACGDDDTTGTTQGNDGGPDTGTASGDSGTDTGTPVVEDAGPDVVVDADAGPPFCAIIGANDWQMSIGEKPCNDCIRANCCAEFTACFSNGDAGSIFDEDGGISECLARFGCWYSSCIEDPDAGPDCISACDPNFSFEANRDVRAVLKCAFGDDPKNPSPGNCSQNAAGQPLCTP